MNSKDHPLVRGAIVEDPAADALTDQLDNACMIVLAARRDEMEAPAWMQAQINHHLAGLSACLHTLHNEGDAQQPSIEKSIEAAKDLLIALHLNADWRQ